MVGEENRQTRLFGKEYFRLEEEGKKRDTTFLTVNV
jgi:hypothetical protein